MPENALGHLDPMFCNLLYLPKPLISDYETCLHVDRHQ